ncbi:hypothetical protein RHGRI_010322 [Rhododendron griersonianum]|uniref:Ferrochelatase n=1 Tax=Rhododendron griersonianum TaxID=479676 RepID=A0AAV6KID2_9ERIC|nr:hypothetical protein RHGRI_010322 [Rhododendron griersonianum]
MLSTDGGIQRCMSAKLFICKFVPSLYGPAQKRNLSVRSFCSLEVCTYPGLESESKSPGHASEERFGVLLLLNLGGPDTLNDVQPFWFNLFADLAIALRNTLESKETPVHVYVAMRYWHPFTEEAVQQASLNSM